MRFLAVIFAALLLAQCASSEEQRFTVDQSAKALVIIGVAKTADSRGPLYTMLWRRLNAEGGFGNFDGGRIIEPRTNADDSVRVRGMGTDLLPRTIAPTPAPPISLGRRGPCSRAWARALSNRVAEHARERPHRRLAASNRDPREPSAEDLAPGVVESRGRDLDEGVDEISVHVARHTVLEMAAAEGLEIAREPALALGEGE